LGSDVPASSPRKDVNISVSNVVSVWLCTFGFERRELMDIKTASVLRVLTLAKVERFKDPKKRWGCITNTVEAEC
jgi:hypothetical protein